jgi:hypothetical protein
MTNKIFFVLAIILWASVAGAASVATTDYVQEGILSAKTYAKTYTDGKIQEAAAYTNAGIASAKQYADDMVEDLAPVATSGSYNDLTNTPEILTPDDLSNAITELTQQINDGTVDLTNYVDNTELATAITNLTNQINDGTIDLTEYISNTELTTAITNLTNQINDGTIDLTGYVSTSELATAITNLTNQINDGTIVLTGYTTTDQVNTSINTAMANAVLKSGDNAMAGTYTITGTLIVPTPALP